jgi:hypothetical protein
MDKARVTQQLTTQDLQATKLHEDTLSAFLYSFRGYTDELHRTTLVTGAQSSLKMTSYTFRCFCYLSEVSGGSLLITGGMNKGGDVVCEVVRIETRRECAVSQGPHMLTPRAYHAAVYHLQHLYVLGGWGSRNLSECERYVRAENRWEALPPLLKACSNMSGVVVESTLYTLGGADGRELDLVQKLSLDRLTWEIMQLRLPQASANIPCFKLRDTEVYLVVNSTLCSFTAVEVRSLKTLPVGISSCCGLSYYSSGTLYCSSYLGAVRSHEIGSLTSL